MNHQEFLDKWLGKKFRESIALWYQCVALDKKYCEEVYGIKWLIFWGSAINGWNGMGNIQWRFERIEWLPQQWDLAFYAPTPTNSAGHTGIVHSAKEILEQNWWAGTGTGQWVDAIRIHKAPANVVGYMRKKDNLDDPVDKRVKLFVKKYNLKDPLKTVSYSQYDTCVILSAMEANQIKWI